MGRRLFRMEAVSTALADLEAWIGPVCTRLAVVGSVRRLRELVHDLDLLAIPRRTNGADTYDELLARKLTDRLMELALMERIHLVPQDDRRLIQIVHVETGVPVDIHLAWNMEEWWGWLVVLTGSKEWIKRVRKQVHGKVCRFHDDGRIELTKGRVARTKDELGVFRTLGISYIKPERRIG